MRKVLAGLLVGAFALAASNQAWAQEERYPVAGRSLTVVVPFPPGGAADITGRLIAQKLSELWGVNGVVENRAGGESMVGAAAVATAKKDGYTIGLVTLDFVINRIMHPKLPYDAVKDFSPVGLVSKSPLYLIVNPKSQVKTLQDLQALSKKKGGDPIAFSSCCSVMLFSTEMLKNAAHLEGLHIPYKGSAPSVNAVLSGETTYAIDTPVSVKSHVEAGKLRALLVTSRKRAAMLPDVPSLTEAGVPGNFELATWWALVMPAGVPAHVVASANDALKKILQMPDIRKRFEDLGIEPAYTTPQGLADLMQSDYLRYEHVARQNKLKLNN